MRLIERKDCPMRHENGNCTAAGGFCTAVNDPICEALHNAFDCGEQSKMEWATLMLAKQNTLFEEKQLAVLRSIHEKVTAQPTIDAVPVVRCAECEKRDKDFVSAKGTISCPYMEAFMPADGFCSYGERKDGE